MEPTTRPDDELAQQAPLVPDIGRGDDTRTDGGHPDDQRPAIRRTPTNPTIQRAYDDEQAQEAPLVPDLGYRTEERP